MSQVEMFSDGFVSGTFLRFTWSYEFTAGKWQFSKAGCHLG